MATELSDDSNRVLRASDLFRCVGAEELLPAAPSDQEYLDLHVDVRDLLEMGRHVL